MQSVVIEKADTNGKAANNVQQSNQESVTRMCTDSRFIVGQTWQRWQLIVPLSQCYCTQMLFTELYRFRCSLMGFDLNRHWQEPSPWAHPTLYATKNLLIEIDNNDVRCQTHAFWARGYCQKFVRYNALEFLKQMCKKYSKQKSPACWADAVRSLGIQNPGKLRSYHRLADEKEIGMQEMPTIYWV